jgi:hypothetical protein
MNEIDNRELRDRILKNLARQKAILRWAFFGVHAVLLFIAVVLLQSRLGDPELAAQIPSPAQDAIYVPLIFLFITLILHFVIALIDRGAADKQFARQAVAQELGNQFIEEQLGWGAEKSKRESAHLDADYVTVNDEGELVPDDEKQAKRSS